MLNQMDLCGTWRARWTDGQRGRTEYANREETDEARFQFDGLDLAASIFLNGQEIGKHANSFHPCRIEVTGKLKVDLNGRSPMPDNFFDVYPGIPYAIPWKSAIPPQILRVGNLKTLPMGRQ